MQLTSKRYYRWRRSSVNESSGAVLEPTDAMALAAGPPGSQQQVGNQDKEQAQSRQLHIGRHMFSLKRVVQWKTAQKDRFEKRQRSLAIDRSLKRDWDLRGRNEYNILLLGADHKGKKEIMQFARRFPEDTYTTGELAGYRLTIYRILIDSVKALVGAMDEFGIVPDSEESKSYCAYLKSSAFPPVDPQKPLEPKVGEAIAALRTDTCIAQVMEHSNAIKLSEDAMHFINSVQRIASPNYLPTPADVCRTRIGESLLSRYSFRNLSVRLFDSGSATRRSRKWEDCFETTVQIAIFVVDLACYDEPLFDDNSLTRMTATLALFKRTVEARWAERMMFVLVMNNLLDFQEKLEQSPLVENFPDYAGGNDSKSACVYLTELFRGLDAREGPDRVHVRFTRSSQAPDVCPVFDAVINLIVCMEMWHLPNGRL